MKAHLKSGESSVSRQEQGTRATMALQCTHLGFPTGRSIIYPSGVGWKSICFTGTQRVSALSIHQNNN